jgi:uncharacterized protein YdbL (DUF1318 family)
MLSHLSCGRGRLVSAVAGAGLYLVLNAGFAHAVTLVEAREAGLVCEQPDGYARAVPGAAVDIVRLVEEANAKRKADYAALAAEGGYTIEAVIQGIWEKRLKQFACK